MRSDRFRGRAVAHCLLSSGRNAPFPAVQSDPTGSHERTLQMTICLAPAILNATGRRDEDHDRAQAGLGSLLSGNELQRAHRVLSVPQIHWLVRRGMRVDLVCCWFDLEP